MSKSIIKAACGLLILLVIVAGLAACGSMEEPDYAGLMTETSLQGMSDCDYDAFTRYLSAEARATVILPEFEASCQEIKDIIGDYIDKEFSKAEIQNSYVVVYYTASYSDEPDDVTITVYFQEIDEEMYIAGLWLDSPKLREAAAATTEE